MVPKALQLRGVHREYFYIKLFAFVWLLCLGVLPLWTLFRNPDGISNLDLHTRPTSGHEMNLLAEVSTNDHCAFRLPDFLGSPDDQRRPLFPNVFCATRFSLLDAMSSGGRIGFDAPYHTRGCLARWLISAEVEMILARFENVVFVGDMPLHSTFAALSMLVADNFQTGALEHQHMTDEEIGACSCENQFLQMACTASWTSTSGGVKHRGATERKPNLHYVKLNDTSVTKDTLKLLEDKRAYKPIPIICSIGYGTSSRLSVSDATDTMSQILAAADASRRKTPMLVIGPTFDASESRQRSSEGQTKLTAWDHSLFLQRTAKERDADFLGMWNLTVQASQVGRYNDGAPAFGPEVAITQAMMVTNWLARLASS